MSALKLGMHLSERPAWAQSRRPSAKWRKFLETGAVSFSGLEDFTDVVGFAAFVRPMVATGSPNQADAEEARIKALLEGWADAVRRHDLPAILTRHERDMVMFDLPPPLQCRGIEAYEQTWGSAFP